MFKKIILTTALVLSGILSFNVSASSISATGLTINEAKQKIEQKANKKGVGYKIIGAHYGNYVYMIAKTTPQ
ncbi:hypothetical protein ACED16_01460 [Enterobacter hormaechei]